MLTFKEQKYCAILLLAVIIIIICMYQSQQMDRKANITVSQNSSREGFVNSISDVQGMESPSRIYRTGRILDSIRSAQNIKYPDYTGANNAFPVTAATMLEMQRAELGKINKGLQNEFIQALQDAEISTLKTRLDKVIEDGKNKGVLIEGTVDKLLGDKVKIRHLASGAVFTAIRKDGVTPTTNTDIVEFGLIINSCNKEDGEGTVDKCIKYLQNDNGANIEMIDCGDIKMATGEGLFRLRKISSNDTYNRALHPDYVMYAIPEYNTLNAYPYYIVIPINDTTGKMCLTIDERGASLEPCDGKHSQRFSIVE